MRILKHRNRKPRKKIDWSRGSAEFIGFAIAIPFLVFVLVAAVNVMQIGILRQSIEHSAYLATRAAVTCDSESLAEAQARTAALDGLSSTTFGIDISSVRVTVDLVGGTSSTTTGSLITWEKGALAKCEVTVPYHSLLFGDNEMKSTYYAMVEQPARTY